MLVKISKAEARRRFDQDLPVILCPCKLRPGGPFSSDVTIFPQAHKDHAKLVGSSDAWSTMYNQWKFYNASHEVGYYASYYKQV